MNLDKTDRKLPGATPELISTDLEAMSASLSDSLQPRPHDGSWASRVCDYTGITLSWTPGPMSNSLEAVYPFVIKGDRIAYHANPNVCTIATAVNYAKKRQAPISLPLLTWIYNGLSNVATMGHIFSLELPHVDQVEKWAQWTPQEQREVLEVLRTGEKRSIVHRLLFGCDGRELFHVSENRWGNCQPSTIKDARDTVYPTLVKIGQQYGLTKEEFDYFLTIPSPRRGERVFYPFYVLSRSQAEENGWDWNSVKSFSLLTARTMAKYCNRWAVAAGRDEPHAAEAMTYFLAAYFCDRIARIKRDKPTATREEILWLNLDRWDVPTVPWARHPFKMSLAKGPDHGIAMMLGLKVPDLERFDPLRHIDLSQRTVELDAWLTNSAMGNNNAADWDSIRTLLRRVPLRHSFWRVDERLGDRIWNGSQTPSLRPVPPSPAFAMPLLPIDDWLNGADQGVLQQQCCGEQFSTIGLLLRHCQERHSYSESPTLRDAVNPDQDDLLKAYGYIAETDTRRHLHRRILFKDPSLQP
ncbi:hypothetical protein MKX07_009003 [Trichoderma sp. CBMAI-0711]|nr:hypothetical protein MKX07_009003 [Trichoderma sp. CBMAI-0711]